MNDFFGRIYEIVAKIPAGKVMTYGQIALILGAPNSARLVGQAMYNTPGWLEIPAHRVVRGDGGLAPAAAFGGEGRQRRLLEDEGVVFNAKGRVDLKKARYT